MGKINVKYVWPVMQCWQGHWLRNRPKSVWCCFVYRIQGESESECNKLHGRVAYGARSSTWHGRLVRADLGDAIVMVGVWFWNLALSISDLYECENHFLLCLCMLQQRVCHPQRPPRVMNSNGVDAIYLSNESKTCVIDVTTPS